MADRQERLQSEVDTRLPGRRCAGTAPSVPRPPGGHTW
jgi:hypothetical protein